MKLFSRKTTFVLGSILGSVAGILFAREGGSKLRAKIKAAATPQRKFEALFHEYLRVGKDVIAELKGHESIQEILDGGKEILGELKKRAKTESNRAVKIAQEKTLEILNEVEKQTGAVRKKAVAKAASYKRKVTRAKKALGVKRLSIKKPARRKATKSKK